MGRPMTKRNMGQGTGKIKVTRYFFQGGSELTAPVAWLVDQRGTQSFTVSDGTTTEVMKLADKVGSLVAGEFAINAVLDNSTVVQVTKLRNRSIQYDGATNIAYTLSGLESQAHPSSDLKASLDIQD